MQDEKKFEAVDLDFPELPQDDEIEEQAQDDSTVEIVVQPPVSEAPKAKPRSED